MENVLIIGGPGNISESTVKYFINKNIPVATLTHSTTSLLGLDEKLTVFRGDRNVEEDIVNACNSFNADVVIDFCCFEVFQAEIMIRAVKKTGCRRFIFVSTVDVYGYPLSNLPMRECDEWREPNCKYAADKKACEELFKEAFKEGLPTLTIARPAYSPGKSFALSAFERNRGKYMVERIRCGKPIYVPGDGNALLQTGAAYNTGLMIARIAESDATIGEDYTCGHNKFNTIDEYVKAFGKVLGREVSITHIPTDFMYSLGREEVEKSILKDLTIHNIYFSVEKFKKVFPDFVWEYDMEDAIRDFVEHQESLGVFDNKLEEQFEDKVVEKWEVALEKLRKELNE